MIAIIGDAGIDRYYRISRFRRQTTHIASYSVLHPAGGSANAAAHAAAAGAEVTLFAAVGHDEAGQLFRAACAVIPRLKIRLRELNEATQGTVVIVEADGERTIVVNPIREVLFPSEQDLALMRTAAVASVNIEEPSARRKWASSCSGLRVLPIAHLHQEESAGCRWDVVIGSLSDHALPDDRHLVSVEAQMCFMTDGAAGGAIWNNVTGWDRWSSPAVHVVDSTGAGDAFLGGVLAAASTSRNPEVLIKSGVERAVACLSVEGAWPS